MESGLEDRNNHRCQPAVCVGRRRLNGVRPRRPEQSTFEDCLGHDPLDVSMESGLEDRNNRDLQADQDSMKGRLNGVRPRRPEQCKSSID